MAQTKPCPLSIQQQILSTFKQFEKKLDKLQEDVLFYGQAVADLQIMVSNMSGPMFMRASADGIGEMPKQLSNKTLDIQYENHEEPTKTRKKTAFKPLSRKIKANSLTNSNRIKMSTEPLFLNKMSSSLRSPKHTVKTRHFKGIPRKTTTLLSQKTKIAK